jgi:C-5 cytosine-specific DNA methylase
MSGERGTIIDLCCGAGGWSDGFADAGFRVIGVDLVKHPAYRHLFIRQDVRTFNGDRCRGRIVGVIASPPCTEFSQTWSFNKSRTPDPASGVELVRACERIAREAGVPLILENVRGAQAHIGRARCHAGSFYLWGDVPALLPSTSYVKGVWNTKHGMPRDGFVRDPALRSKVPYELAKWIADTWPA